MNEAPTFLKTLTNFLMASFNANNRIKSKMLIMFISGW